MISDQEAFVSITRAEICDLWPDFECHIASKNRPKLQSRPDLGGERLNINSRKSHTRSGMSGFCVENKKLKKKLKRTRIQSSSPCSMVVTNIMASS